MKQIFTSWGHFTGVIPLEVAICAACTLSFSLSHSLTETVVQNGTVEEKKGHSD